MVKHPQTISRQFADELFECVWPFVGLTLKGLKSLLILEFERCFLPLSNIQKQSFADVLQNGCCKNFENLTRKQLCWSLFLIRPEACNFFTELFLQNISGGCLNRVILTHFMPPFFFLYALKTSENLYLMFSGGVQKDQWHEMGQTL